MNITLNEQEERRSILALIKRKTLILLYSSLLEIVFLTLTNRSQAKSSVTHQLLFIIVQWLMLLILFQDCV